MDRRIMAIMAVLAIGITAFSIPLEDTDAEPISTTMSSEYIYHATLEWKGEYRAYSYGSTLYFNEGSSNHSAMLQYLKDHETVVYQDDRDKLSGTVHAYKTSSWFGDSYINITVQDSDNLLLIGEEVQRPYNNTFFVKVGDTITISASKITNSFGESCPAYIDGVDISTETYVEKAKISKEVSITFDNVGSYNRVPALFNYITYEMTGNSEPNGSANVFIALCTVMAVIGLGLLIVAAMKPKWSK